MDYFLATVAAILILGLIITAVIMWGIANSR